MPDFHALMMTVKQWRSCLFASEVSVLPGTDVIYWVKRGCRGVEKETQTDVTCLRRVKKRSWWIMFCSPNVKWNHITFKLQYMFGIQQHFCFMLKLMQANIWKFPKKQLQKQSGVTYFLDGLQMFLRKTTCMTTITNITPHWDVITSWWQ